MVKKAKKRQRRRKYDPKPGDVVAIPLRDGRIAFARFYSATEMAVFDHLAERLLGPECFVDVPSAFVASTLNAPIYRDSNLEEGEWVIVGRLPFLRPEEAIPPPTYLEDMLKPGRYSIVYDDEFITHNATEEDIAGLESYQPVPASEIVERIERELGGKTYPAHPVKRKGEPRSVVPPRLKPLIEAAQKAREEEQEELLAVLVVIKLKKEEFPEADKFDQVQRLERKLRRVIESSGEGEFDEAKFERGKYTIAAYAGDPHRLFTLIEPILRKSEFAGRIQVHLQLPWDKEYDEEVETISI